MLIGRVSELTGASRKAIRHYEVIGLIPIPQRKGEYRVYTEHDVAVISMIKRAQTLGFSLTELKGLVLGKNAEGEFPIDIACALIDKKTLELKREAQQLLDKEKNLQRLKIDLVNKFT